MMNVLVQFLRRILRIEEDKQRLQELVGEAIELQKKYIETTEGMKDPVGKEIYQNLAFLRLRVLRVPMVTV